MPTIQTDYYRSTVGLTGKDQEILTLQTDCYRNTVGLTGKLLAQWIYLDLTQDYHVL